MANSKISGGSRPSHKGRGGGHPDPEIRGGRLKNKLFRPFRPQFGRKIRGVPPLVPPLKMVD